MVAAMTDRCRWMLDTMDITYNDDDGIAALVADNYPNLRQVVHLLQTASLDGTLKLQHDADVATPDALLAALTDNDTRRIIAWVTDHTTAGRTGTQLANLLTDLVIKHQPPTAIAGLVWTIATNDALPSSDNRRHCLNLALQTAAGWG